MDSNKSRPNRQRSLLEPQRARGKLRVASLMEAAAAVIAEKGFEAATMAEIAIRAGAQIGSLYRFFPNKEVLADALIQRYGELIDEAFGKIRVEVDGESVARHWRVFSLHRTRRYEFSVGQDETHDIVMELTRKSVVGGFRSQTCQVFVDGESVGTYVSRPIGKTTKKAA